MACSPEKMAANKLNAQKSTGPRTDEGKAASRRNSLKHGLTGAGVVLPGEDVEAIAHRFTAFQAELSPRGEVGRFHVNRAALLSVRIERFARFETVILSSKMRRAVATFDEDRLTEVDRLLHWMPEEPYTSLRRLVQIPEGCDRIVEHFEAIRSDLTDAQQRWTPTHYHELEWLAGVKPNAIPRSRVSALSDAMYGDASFLEPGEAEGLDREQLRAWATMQLVAHIDEKIARVRERRSEVDLDAIALERSEAMDRALVDTSPEMILARKYEAAAVRELNKTFERIDRLNDATEPVDVMPIPPSPSESVGSIFPGEMQQAEADLTSDSPNPRKQPRHPKPESHIPPELTKPTLGPPPGPAKG